MSGTGNGAIITGDSEDETQRQLHNSRRLCRTDDAEICIPQGVSGHIEVRDIEHVEEFSAELSPKPFADGNALRYAHIDVLALRPA